MPSDRVTCVERGRYQLDGAVVRLRGSQMHGGKTCSLLTLTVERMPSWRPPAWASIDLPTLVPGARPTVLAVRSVVERLREQLIHLPTATTPTDSILGYAHALLLVRELTKAQADALFTYVHARRGLPTFSRSEGLLLRALDDWRQQIAAGDATWPLPPARSNPWTLNERPEQLRAS